MYLDCFRMRLITETPCAPAMPEIVDSSTSFIKIRWKEPSNDGGAAITGYYVERRDKNTGSWIRLNEQPITVSDQILAALF